MTHRNICSKLRGQEDQRPATEEEPLTEADQSQETPKKTLAAIGTTSYRELMGRTSSQGRPQVGPRGSSQQEAARTCIAHHQFRRYNVQNRNYTRGSLTTT